MSAVPAGAPRRSHDHQVIGGLPKLELVPTPAPARGFYGTVILCVSLFLGAFGLVFFLNTQMVATAYELQNVNQQINEAAATESTLMGEVVSVSTPEGLAQQADDLGLVPAEDIRHLDLKTGTVVLPADPDAQFQVAAQDSGD
ncbi:MAG: hypothetical protein ACTHW1_03885 [Ancrocorticia sp.]|uniref:hypothetical protein n=1 Tax=Ancrocorticia sp. TaxID=2593684 RepID=UPI003F8F8B25